MSICFTDIPCCYDILNQRYYMYKLYTVMHVRYNVLTVIIDATSIRVNSAIQYIVVITF